MISNEQLSQLNKLQSQYRRIEELLSYEEVVLDKKLCLNLTKQKAQLLPIISNYEKFLTASNMLKEFNELLQTSNSSDYEMISVEIKSLNEKLEQQKNETLKSLSLFNAITQNIVIEIIGETASKFKTDIIKGYQLFCQNNNLEYSLKESKNTTFINIKGLNAKEFFLSEIGIHETENKEQLQIFVYDSYNEDTSIDDKDLIITTCHSSGAGGQHINTTDSAVKIVHKKTGISVICQSERSQIQNKNLALKNIQEKIKNHFEKLENNHIKSCKKEQLDLMKKNQITKSYNYKNNSIVRNNNTTIKLSEFILGKII